MKIANLLKPKQKNTFNIKGMKNKSFYDEIATLKTAEGCYNFVKEIVNPDEILRRTGKGVDTLRLLLNEGQVATCVDSRRAGITSLSYRLKYTDTSDKYKDFYGKILKNLDIDSIIKDILNTPLFGYQPIEIVWQYKEGAVIPEKVLAKPQEWFFYNADKQLCFRQKGKNDGVIINPEERKFLCPRNNPDYLNPYGQSVLSRCFWDIAFKKGGMEFWIKFIEKFAIPYIIGKYESGISDDDKNKLLEMLTKLFQDAVAAIPNDSSVEIKEASSKSASAEIFKDLIKICNDNIAKNILGQTLTTESGTSGSYALGEVHQQVRHDIILSDKKLVESTMNILLQHIHYFNFNDENVPAFELYEEKNADKENTERDVKLAGIGVRFTKNYLMKTYGYEEDDIIVNETENLSSFSEPVMNNHTTPIDDFIDSFSDEKLEDIISEKIKPIIQHFSENKDPEKALEELAVLYPDKNSADLEETLTKALFLADLFGRSEIDG